MSNASPQVQDRLIGQVVGGNYYVERLLARGGMGYVYKGRHKTLDRPVAVKILRGDLCEDEKVVKRFIREALAVSQLHHPHTVQVLDSGQTPEGVYYIVMEFLEGESLDRVLATKGPLTPEAAVTFIGQAAAALGEAHRKGIVHRDLKPANIFLVRAPGVPDFVKLLDFGIAKFYTGRKDGQELTKLTNAGSTMGTPHYMAPEQIRGEEIDGRADVYSLGVILFEMLVGRPSYMGDSPMEIFLGHLEEPIPKLRDYIEDRYLPRGLQRVLETAMAKRADERFETMEMFKVALDNLLGVHSGALNLISLKEKQAVITSRRNNFVGRMDTVPEVDSVKQRLMIGMVALVVLGVTVLLFALFFLVLADDDDAETQASEVEVAASAPTKHVKIVSSPSGARVLLNGEKVGITPYHHVFEDDVSELMFELIGMDERSALVRVVPIPHEVRGAAVSFEQGLEADSDAMQIRVESVPPGATIIRDNKDTDLQTPIDLRVPNNGQDKIQVVLERDGFISESYIVPFTPGAVLELSSTLVQQEGRAEEQP